MTWEHHFRHPIDGRPRRHCHYLDVRRCLACGYPLIQHRFIPDPAEQTGGSHEELEPFERIIYPIAPRRDLAPDEVRAASTELAADYDEAGACEPHSLQAATLLLRRCATVMLVEKCSANKKDTLGRQFDQAENAGERPDFIVEQFDGLLKNRNRSAHPWFSQLGEPLKVEQDDVEWCFEIVGLMLEHFYVGPARRGRRIARLNKIVSSKA